MLGKRMRVSGEFAWTMDRVGMVAEMADDAHVVCQLADETRCERWVVEEFLEG